jgi:hypothetical protein
MKISKFQNITKNQLHRFWCYNFRKHLIIKGEGITKTFSGNRSEWLDPFWEIWKYQNYANFDMFYFLWLICLCLQPQKHTKTTFWRLLVLFALRYQVFKLSQNFNSRYISIVNSNKFQRFGFICFEWISKNVIIEIYFVFIFSNFSKMDEDFHAVFFHRTSYNSLFFNLKHLHNLKHKNLRSSFLVILIVIVSWIC